MTTHKVVSTVRKMGQRGWSKQETLYQQRQKAQPDDGFLYPLAFLHSFHLRYFL